MKKMLLKVNKLQVKYGEQTALDIRTPICIAKGERIGIIGSNGAGKSTFVKSVLGLTDYKGNIVTDLKQEEMAVHMQHNHYVNTMPVKYIMETMLNTKIQNDERLQELITFFEFEDCLKKKYSVLSGGQQQRLTIIMVMMQNAPLTFFDEVTSGLDFETRQRLMEKLIRWYDGKDNTLCIVSHYYEELEMFAEKILILDGGKVIDFGEKQELFRKHCGNAALILENTEENRRLTKRFRKIGAPEHLLAISCKNAEEEKEAIGILVEHNVNFKRSSSDIEIMSINAKKRLG